MFNSNQGYSLADIAAATGNNNNNGGCFGGDCAWWVIILFLFVFCGWGGYGYGGFGGGNTPQATSVYEGYVLNNDMSTLSRQIADTTAMTERKLDNVTNGLSDGFYTNAQLINGIDRSIANGVYSLQSGLTQNQIADMQNTNTITAGITGLGTQMASCCCDLRYENAKNFSDINYRMAEQSCQTRQAVADATATIVANQDANTRSILDFLTQDKIASLITENSALKAAANNAAQTYDIVSQLKAQAPVPAYVVPNPYCNCGSCGC